MTFGFQTMLELRQSPGAEWVVIVQTVVLVHRMQSTSLGRLTGV
jgi:hypothetical protein